MKHLRLKLISLITFGLCIGASTQAFADAPIRQAGNFGIGVGGGNRVLGLSMKYFQSQSNAFQFVVGFRDGDRWCDDDYWDGRRRCRDRYWGGDYIGLNADYLFELGEFVQTDVINIGPSVGAGVGLGIWDDGVDLSINGVGGLEFMLNPVPIDFVVEWRPTIHVVPGVDLNLVEFTGHVRYYF